ncbi:TetR/AcrR family transcriptional regulator [Aquimarina sp. 2201CG14-23]|uniref:TetR/AcrR family transcriptional regulator n=1 Tax=Aquimarina mycalae TaxID=3040073 RepID=UPI002477D81F|nr:TetR/AcrR family transcriptional regulator [Aquimarina sp. 2201CG14-23]MDH7444847.1 TetR/AcrR family transcriptional regulator [Aquimarina sp. 2201CG14-23]
MKYILQDLKVNINNNIYLKDPESSTLGKKIVEYSILLIDEIGFDCFTFKKLGEKIGSNESSIYRYFENKHKLLLYLTSWYWGWLEYQLVFTTNSISDSKEKLKKSIEIITRTTKEDSSFSHINEVLLNKIVVNEYSKSYLTKEVDKENKEGYFSIYKRLVNRIKDMIIEVDAVYPYPSSLSSTIIEGALHQHFLKDHFSSLTDCNEKITPTTYFIDLVFNSLNNTKND